MADPVPPETRRAQSQIKYGMLLLIAINLAILIKVFFGGSSSPAKPAVSVEFPPSKEANEPPPPERLVVSDTKPMPSPQVHAVAIHPAEQSNPQQQTIESDRSLPNYSDEGPTFRFQGVALRVGKSASIVGKIFLAYEPPPEIEITPIKADRNCGPLHDKPVMTRRYVVAPDGGFADVVVSIRSGLEGFSFPVPPEQPQIDQVGCMYEPYITTAMTGQSIRIRNSDPFMHNVNAQTKINPAFNFAQSVQGQENIKSFSRPEMIKLICNIHPWMTGYLRIFDHPFHTVTDTNGEFALPPGLPSGKYSIEFAHLKAGKRTTDLNYQADTNLPYRFFLSFHKPPTAEPDLISTQSH